MQTAKHHSTLLILALIIAGFLLRIFLLNDIPAILNRDEAALAYNAVLLLQTGTDEWGRARPIALESFGDYKLPGYVALLIGLFSILPEQDWVVRLPAVIAGTSLIPLAFILSRQLGLTGKKPWLAAFLLSTTPVFFFYSRMAFEAIVGLALLLTALTLLFRKVKVDRFGWLLDCIALLPVLAAVFTYNTPLLLLPTFIVLLPVFRGWKNWQNWLPPVIGLLLVFSATMYLLLPLTAQKSGITIFSDETVLTNSSTFRQNLPQLLQPIIGNRYLYYLSIMSNNFIASFGPTFLVTQGGEHPWHSLPNYGHLLWSTYILGSIGIAVLLKDSVKELLQRKLPTTLLPLWLLVTSLAPSIITVDAPHTTRSLFFFFWWIVIASFGLEQITKAFTKLLKKKHLGNFIAPSVLVLCLLPLAEFSGYLYTYFTEYPKNQPAELQVGFDTAIKDANQKYPDSAVAVVDPDGYLYITAAWYLQTTPEEYFQTVVRQQPNSIGFKYGEQLSQFHFIAQESDRLKTGESVILFREDSQWQLTSY